MNKEVFITGGTGYMGRRLICILLQNDYKVSALVRKGSEGKLPSGCTSVVASPFDRSSFDYKIPKGSTFVQLLGVPHPKPSKKQLFRSIDLVSAIESANAAKKGGVSHFVYVSVAQEPTKVMQDYQHCRAEAEEATSDLGLRATFIRPWYVIGPGHYWPLLFQPLFKVLEWIPSTSRKAKALRIVYLSQMLRTLMYAIEHPPVENARVIEIDEIREM